MIHCLEGGLADLSLSLKQDNHYVQELDGLWLLKCTIVFMFSFYLITGDEGTLSPNDTNWD